MYKFSKRSENNLAGVHPDLVKVIRRALQISEIDFVVIEGVRSIARQKELVAAGASWTMNSRHITGHAVDLVPYVGGVRWDWPLFDKIAEAVVRAATELDVDISWGGWWTQKDGPHFELNRRSYG